MLIILTLVVYGLVLGSFINALVWRLHEQDVIKERLAELQAKKRTKKTSQEIAGLETRLRQRSMGKGRSMCSDCQHPLAPKDLVPLFSWLWLRGRCRYCRRPIQDPPLVEVVVPALFVVSYLVWPQALTGYGLLAFLFWLVFLVGFVALSLYDIRWQLLPDVIVWPLVALAVVQVLLHAFAFGGGLDVLFTAAWGVAIASGIFLVLFMVAERLGREWIGFGDVKLGIVLGLLVGGPMEAILVLYIASISGLLASLPYLLRHKLGRGSLIPFGPFLMLGCLVVVLFGGAIVGWLERLLSIG